LGKTPSLQGGSFSHEKNSPRFALEFFPELRKTRRGTFLEYRSASRVFPKAEKNSRGPFLEYRTQPHSLCGFLMHSKGGSTEAEPPSCGAQWSRVPKSFKASALRAAHRRTFDSRCVAITPTPPAPVLPHTHPAQSLPAPRCSPSCCRCCTAFVHGWTSRERAILRLVSAAEPPLS
jgi:hypothetical protein